MNYWLEILFGILFLLLLFNWARPQIVTCKEKLIDCEKVRAQLDTELSDLRLDIEIEKNNTKILKEKVAKQSFIIKILRSKYGDSELNKIVEDELKKIDGMGSGD